MKKYIAMAAVAMMFAACTNDDMPEVPAVDSMTDTPVTLTVGVTDLSTRAGHDEGELKTGSMGFYMTTADTPSDNRYNAENREVKYENDRWNVQGDMLLWRNETSTVNYIAYHPYDLNASNKIVTVIAPTNQDHANVVDFLYVNGATTSGDSRNGINLTMNHKMSKLLVTLRAGTELGTMPDFKEVIIKGMKNQCEFDLAAGAWKNPVAATADIIMVQENNNNHEAIVIPQTLDEFVVEITTADDRKFRYSQKNVALESGMVYTLNLIVGKDIVELAEDGITVGGWKDGINDDLVTE